MNKTVTLNGSQITYNKDTRFEVQTAGLRAPFKVQQTIRGDLAQAYMALVKQPLSTPNMKKRLTANDVVIL